MTFPPSRRSSRRYTADVVAPLLFDRSRSLRDAHLSRRPPRSSRPRCWSPAGRLTPPSAITRRNATRRRFAWLARRPRPTARQDHRRGARRRRRVGEARTPHLRRRIGRVLYLDLARAACPSTRHHDVVVERLQRHGREVSVESSLRSARRGKPRDRFPRHHPWTRSGWR